MTEEIWKDVPGTDGQYQVSNLGRARSINVLKPYVRPHTGYAVCSILMARGVRHTCRTVHGLVAEAFIGPRPEGLVINHKDGNKTNNCVENLEYITQTENQRHARDVLGVRRDGSHNVSAKLTIEQVDEIRRLYATGQYAQKELAKMFGCGQPHISSLVIRKSWFRDDYPSQPVEPKEPLES